MSVVINYCVTSLKDREWNVPSIFSYLNNKKIYLCNKYHLKHKKKVRKSAQGFREKNKIRLKANKKIKTEFIENFNSIIFIIVSDTIKLNVMK